MTGLVLAVVSHVLQSSLLPVLEDSQQDPSLDLQEDFMWAHDERRRAAVAKVRAMICFINFL